METLATRIRHRLRFVESYHDRKLMVEVLEVLEGPDFVPKVVHPAETDGSSLGGFTPEAVITWLADNGVRLVPWQITKLNRL